MQAAPKPPTLLLEVKFGSMFYLAVRLRSTSPSSRQTPSTRSSYSAKLSAGAGGTTTPTRTVVRDSAKTSRFLARTTSSVSHCVGPPSPSFSPFHPHIASVFFFLLVFFFVFVTVVRAPLSRSEVCTHLVLNRLFQSRWSLHTCICPGLRSCLGGEMIGSIVSKRRDDGVKLAPGIFFRTECFDERRVTFESGLERERGEPTITG